MRSSSKLFYYSTQSTRVFGINNNGEIKGKPPFSWKLGFEASKWVLMVTQPPKCLKHGNKCKNTKDQVYNSK